MPAAEQSCPQAQEAPAARADRQVLTSALVAVLPQTPLSAHLPEVAVPHRPGVDEPVALEDEMNKLLLTPVEEQ